MVDIIIRPKQNYGAREAKDPRGIRWLGSCDHESDVWSWHWIHLSALLEGVLDTSALAITWFILGAILGQATKAAEGLQKQPIGVVAMATGTAVETGLAVKKSRFEINDTVLLS